MTKPNNKNKDAINIDKGLVSNAEVRDVLEIFDESDNDRDKSVTDDTKESEGDVDWSHYDIKKRSFRMFLL